MSVAAVLDLAASCLGLFSALFFCIGILHLNPNRAEEIATKMWGKGQAIAEEMLLQKSDFIVGAILLLLSFLVQFIVKAFPAFLSQLATQEQLHGVAISIAIASAIAVVARTANRRIGKVFLRQLQERTAGKV
ncbi:hypothetical protein [Quatrionicoccus australiensis]|uniref:hypothetical protein n=1 Tax=Quatrionicoccus australiensis TaxID=138118 RepID=UPI001CF97FBE|nr:hypothetical protein [Quatrionicoccus australiensis]MCB4358276.1 hypothetical protein [Quatrionicoccus australiensis]